MFRGEYLESSLSFIIRQNKRFWCPNTRQDILTFKTKYSNIKEKFNLKFFVKMKKVTLILVIAVLAVIGKVFAQTPQILLQKCFGGTGDDDCLSLKECPDSTFIVAGATASVEYTHALQDFFYVHIGQNFDSLWYLAVGGSGTDILNEVIWIHHGAHSYMGYAGACQENTPSNNGDIYQNDGGFDGAVDMIGTDSQRAWDVTYGGSSDDVLKGIVQNADDGFTSVGWTLSNDSDIHSNHGQKDGWFLITTFVGQKVISKCIGGSGDDMFNSITATKDGGYIMAGSTTSTDGDVSGNHGGTDVWIVKVDANGGIQWQKCLGGSGEEEANSVAQTSDSGYIVCGYTTSTDGDVTGGHGDSDYWVVKLDKNGAVEWQKCFGGSGSDLATSVIQRRNGHYAIAGYSNSTAGDVSGNHGDYDYWILELDSAGNLLWELSLGGTDADYAHEIVETYDGALVIGGTTHSNNGDVSGNHGPAGTADFWVVKLSAQTASGIAEAKNETGAYAYPNPAGETATVLLAEMESGEIEIFNFLGEQILRKEFKMEKSIPLSVSSLSSGIYFIKISVGGKSFFKKLVKN